MKKLHFIFIAFLFLGANSGYAQISGTVFRDFNGNGMKDTNEPFVPGVTVNAYGTSGASCGTAVTSGNSAPNYTLNGCTGNVRLEFVLPAADADICAEMGVDFTSYAVASNNTSVQFVNGTSTGVNYALQFPGDYNTGLTSVSAFVPCYINGDPLPSGSSSGAMDWFVGFPANSSGTGAPPQKLSGEVIGATWGVAYSKVANRIFTSAFLKRHVGLGVMGSGGIYMLEPTATSFNVTQFHDMDSNPVTRTRATTGTYGEGVSFNFVNDRQVSYIGAVDPLSGAAVGLGVIGSNTERVLPVLPSQPSYDPAAFGQIGKVGMGDIEISEDGKYLFVSNLYQRKVFRLELDNPSAPTSVVGVIEIEIPSGISCTNGILRPFGLKTYRGDLYIGAVCTGENGGQNIVNGASDLQAYVFKVEDAAISSPGSATSILNFDLNYDKGFVRTGVAGTNQWYPWTDNGNDRVKEACCEEYFKGQPILSNIDFTDRGDLTMAFMDRWGHQMGHSNYIDLRTTGSIGNSQGSGDLLIAGIDCDNDAYVLENDGGITSINGSTWSGNITNNQGPGAGEFFQGESYLTFHEETSMGAIAQLKGSNLTFLTVYDPVSTIRTGGVLQLSNMDGAKTDGYQLYDAAVTSGTFGKSHGLGDIELSGIEPPLEIGNRIWKDTDLDGVQDAGEVGIEGVEIELVEGGSVIATATSDPNGQWYFNTSDGLKPNTDYIIRVKTALDAGALAGCTAYTVKDAATGGVQDLGDSDAASDGTIAYRTGNFGENDHTIDIGLAEAVACVNPEAGDDVTICQPKSTLKLKDAPTGTEWVVAAGNTATIDAATGAITGTADIGTYTFTLQTIGDPTCKDDIVITVTANTPHLLCNDGSTSITANAEPGVTNVVWFNSAGTQIGTGSSLIINSNTTGLADGNEWFYYTGTGADNCDVELCCPVMVITEDCCPTPNCLSVTVIKN